MSEAHEHIPSRDTPLIDRLSQRIAELNHECEASMGEIAALRQTIADLYIERDKALSEVAAARRQIKALNGLSRMAAGTIEALQNAVEEKNRLIDAMRACRDNEERD